MEQARIEEEEEKELVVRESNARIGPVEEKRCEDVAWKDPITLTAVDGIAALGYT